MVTVDLIDTTEMYLKTIFELEEDGITPLRARIVDRLGHSGPTVSQTVARMERDGLVHREVFPEVPPRVEYSLTETGQTLQPVIEAMKNWGTQYKAAHAA